MYHKMPKNTSIKIVLTTRVSASILKPITSMEICAPNAATGRESTGAKIPERQTIKQKIKKVKEIKEKRLFIDGNHYY